MNTIESARNWFLEKFDQSESKDHLSHLPSDIFVEIFKYLRLESARSLHISERKITFKTDVVIKIMAITLTQQYLEKLVLDLPNKFVKESGDYASFLEYKEEFETYPDRSPEKLNALRQAICSFFKGSHFQVNEFKQHGLDQDNNLFVLLLSNTYFIVFPIESDIQANKFMCHYLDMLETNQIEQKNLRLCFNKTLNDKLLKRIENICRDNLYINEISLATYNLSNFNFENVYKAIKNNLNIMKFTISDSNGNISIFEADWQVVNKLKEYRRNAFRDFFENMFKESFLIKEDRYTFSCIRLL